SSDVAASASTPSSGGHMRPGVRYIGTQGPTSERGVSASSAGMSSTTCASTGYSPTTSSSTMGASTTGASTTCASMTCSSTTDAADPTPQSAIGNPHSSRLASATDAAVSGAIGAGSRMAGRRSKASIAGSSTADEIV